jgi:hypothetical protein
MSDIDKYTEYFTGFWKMGDVTIPLWRSKSGASKRFTLDDYKAFGGPIPTAEHEKIYREWCEKNNKTYLPPLH